MFYVTERLKVDRGASHHFCCLYHTFRLVGINYLYILIISYTFSIIVMDKVDNTEPEPADLWWSGQKIGLDFNLLMCYGITNNLASFMESGDSYIAIWLGS